MNSTFKILNPAVVSRVGKLDMWNELVRLLGEMAEAAQDVGPFDSLDVKAHHPASGDFFHMQLGIPLRIEYCLHRAGSRGTSASDIYHVWIYLKDGVCQATLDLNPRTEYHGSTSEAVSALVGGISSHFNRLRQQFIPAKG